MKLSDMLQQPFAYLIMHGVYDALVAILLGVVGYRLAYIFPRLLGRVTAQAGVDPTLITFLTNVSRYTLLIFVTIFVSRSI